MTAPTPAPEAPERRRWWSLEITPLRAVVTLVLVLALLEGGLRIIQKQLPRPVSGDQVEVQLKWEQVQELHQKDAPVDALFLGNSTMDAGLDPAVFADASRKYDHPYNAALLGQPLTSVNRWADQFVLADLHPDVVVIGLTPLDIPQVDLFGVSKSAVESAFDTTLDRLHESALQRLDERMSNYSALVRNRNAFRSPVELWRATRNTVEGVKPQFTGVGPTTLQDGRTVPRTEQVWRDQLLQPRGGNANYWGHEFDGVSVRKMSPQERTALHDSTIDTGQIATLVDTIHRHGIDDVVLVIMPHDLDALRSAGADLGSFRRGARQITAYGQQHDLPVIDFTDSAYPASWYFDLAHLGRTGSEKFSQQLAGVLDGL